MIIHSLASLVGTRHQKLVMSEILTILIDFKKRRKVLNSVVLFYVCYFRIPSFLNRFDTFHDGNDDLVGT